MALLNLTNLDFDQIKVSIIDYLKSNSDFTDYDFEGSNLSTIIDVLAYNTYISSYNANMVSNECFIDSATLRENVVYDMVTYLTCSSCESAVEVYRKKQPKEKLLEVVPYEEEEGIVHDSEGC